MRGNAERAVLLGAGRIMKVSGLGRAHCREYQQAKPHQPDFVTAAQRTALPVHAFPYVSNTDDNDTRARC